MKIVMDTGVILTALFFGGTSRKIVEAVAQKKVAAYATREIVVEYRAALAKMTAKKPGDLRPDLLLPITTRLHIIEEKPKPPLCRHPGDDRFLSCALVYIVTGFKDLRLRGAGKSVSMMTAEDLGQRLSL